MKTKYRIKSTIQFFAFAFYPKTTLIVSTIISVIAITLLSWIMSVSEEDSSLYNIAFALITGAVASFFVAIIVELSNNYRHNKLAWYELQDYYQCITDYENMKQALMQPFSLQKAEENARYNFTEEEGNTVVTSRDDEYKPKDIVEATWTQLPNIIPIFIDTLKYKKAFLSDKEIEELKHIIILHNQIKEEIHTILLMSPMIHNATNHPDESYLEGMYPKNILSDMPEWIKKHLASRESQNAMERLAHDIVSDTFLSKQFLKNYDISQNGIDNYHYTYDEQSIDDNIEYDTEEDEMEYNYPETEEEFKTMNDQYYKQLEESQRPFVSWHISKCCFDISNSIEELEKIIIKKPYYSIFLEFFKKFDSDSSNQANQHCA